MSDKSTGELILALNAGSSSLKFAIFVGHSLTVRLLSGAVERIGLTDATFTVRDAAGQRTEHSEIHAPNHASCVDLLMNQIAKLGDQAALSAIGHRVVHGGVSYTRPQRVTSESLSALRRLSPFAPEHLPAEIDLIAALAERFPSTPQVACFDTAFHRKLPRVARLLPIPRCYEAKGVRRYGFHGLSFEFLMEELARVGDPTVHQGRVVLAHLGNGASLAAVRDGQCVDTSMAFTPAAGLMMGRRSGDLDPGVLSYLARTERMTAMEIDRLANHQSGLFGVSETSSDMRELLAREETDSRAADAVALFCYTAKKWVGGFTAALGGLDTLVFAGGIGENSPIIRARICAGMEFLGLELDEARNGANAAVVSVDSSRVTVRVVPTDEELMIARSVCRVLGLDVPKPS